MNSAMAFLDFFAIALAVSLASLFLVKTFVQACRKKENACTGCTLGRANGRRS